MECYVAKVAWACAEMQSGTDEVFCQSKKLKSKHAIY